MGNKNKVNYFIYIFVAMLIVISDDTLFFGTNKNTLYITIKYFFISFIFVMFFLKSIIMEKKYKSSSFFICIIMIFIMILSAVWNNDVRFGIIYKCMLLIVGFGISQTFSLYAYAFYFNKTMYVLSIWSLLGFCINLIFPHLTFQFIPIIYNSINRAYYNFFLTTIPCHYPNVRNWSIFREPGIYQMFLVLALLLEFGVLKKSRLKYIVIYIITILSTKSTTGYLALFLILILYGYTSFKKKKKNTYKYFVGCIVIIFIITVIGCSSISLKIFEEVFGKLNNMKRYTTIARVGSITENIKIFYQNIILGVGLTSISEQFPILCLKNYGHLTRDNTNTILIQFATHGLIYGFFYCLGIIKFCKYCTKSYIELWIFIGVFLIILSGENLSFSLFTYILIFYGFKYSKNYKFRKRRREKCINQQQL